MKWILLLCVLSLSCTKQPEPPKKPMTIEEAMETLDKAREELRKIIDDE